MKKEFIANEISHAASSILSEEHSTEMSRLVDEKAQLCSIYSMDFINITEVPVLDVEKDLNKDMDFVLADPFYNI